MAHSYGCHCSVGSKAGIDNVVGTPWGPVGGDSEQPIATWVDRPSAQVPVQVPPLPDHESQVRRTYIRKMDVHRYGFAERCPGCRAIHTRLDKSRDHRRKVQKKDRGGNESQP